MRRFCYGMMMALLAASVQGQERSREVAIETLKAEIQARRRWLRNAEQRLAEAEKAEAVSQDLPTSPLTSPSIGRREFPTLPARNPSPVAESADPVGKDEVVRPSPSSGLPRFPRPERSPFDLDDPSVVESTLRLPPPSEERLEALESKMDRILSAIEGLKTDLGAVRTEIDRTRRELRRAKPVPGPAR